MYQTLLKRASVALLLIVAVLAATSTAFAQGENQNNPNLPPDGVYLSPDQVHAMYSGAGLAIVLQAVQHQPFAGQPVDRHPVAADADGVPNDEQEQFNSGVQGMVSVNNSPFQPAQGTGPVVTLVHDRLGNVTGTFQTEMLSMDLTGTSPFGPFKIRESPTLQSLGQTKITDIGGGMFHIDSFFDVFTELSIDGGNTWMPDTQGPVRMNLVPEPTSAVIFGVGALAMIGVSLRRRKK